MEYFQVGEISTVALQEESGGGPLADFAAGALPPTFKTVPFEDAVQAYEEIVRGPGEGKRVLTFS